MSCPGALVCCTISCLTGILGTPSERVPYALILERHELQQKVGKYLYPAKRIGSYSLNRHTGEPTPGQELWIFRNPQIRPRSGEPFRWICNYEASVILETGRLGGASYECPRKPECLHSEQFGNQTVLLALANGTIDDKCKL